MENRILPKICILLIALSLTSCATKNSSHSRYVQTAGSTHEQLFMGDNNLIWTKLQRLSTKKLLTLQTRVKDPLRLGWIELALINKRYSTNSQALAQQIDNWKVKFDGHPALDILPSNELLHQIATDKGPRQLAILLPLHGKYGRSGKRVRAGILNAHYSNTNQKKPRIKFYDTAGHDDNIVDVYKQAASEGADFVIGPLTKGQVNNLQSYDTFNVPVLALNYSQAHSNLPTNLFEYGLLPEDEIVEIADTARNRGLSRAIVITPDNKFGKRMANAFNARWSQIGGTVQETWYYPNKPSAFNHDVAKLMQIDPKADKKLMHQDNSRETLSQQRRQDFDAIFLFGKPHDARLIVPLLKYYYAGKTPIFASSSIYSGNPNPTKDVDLNGVTICDTPWSIKAAQSGHKNYSKLFTVGRDAYLVSQLMQRMQAMPNFAVYGATGVLSLAENNKIRRRLPCVKFANGRI